MHDIRDDFPIFDQPANKGLVYLDSTATALKPQSVIDAEFGYYREYSANVFRGIYRMSEKATQKYEEARGKVARFIGGKPEETIFVRNASEAINLVAYGWGRMNVEKGDVIVTTIMEHHSNFVPWQVLCEENGAVFKIVGVTDEGELAIDDHHKIKTQRSKIKTENKNSLSALKSIISKKTKLVALTHVSNVLGTINPIKELTAAIKQINPSCLVLVDGAQSIPHMNVDVEDLGVDFYVFSGHKMLGPTGIGVLWGRFELLCKMAPFMYGGEMIAEVTLNQTTFKRPPLKFEAGTPAIAQAIGLGAAIDYLILYGMDKVRAHEAAITDYALGTLKKIPGLTIYGPAKAEDRGGVIAFNIADAFGKSIHSHDVADILGQRHICVRAGHHCAMPLHTYLEVPGSVRASFYVYSVKEDVDALVEGLRKVQATFAR